MYLPIFIAWSLVVPLSTAPTTEFPDQDCADSNEPPAKSTTLSKTLITTSTTHPPHTHAPSGSEFKNVSFLSKEFIESINKNSFTWAAQKNFPEKMSFLELRRLGGSVRYSKSVGPRAIPNLVHHEPTHVPREFDAREKWPMCQSIRTIRNQGKCGSCWAIQAASTISDRICIGTEGKVQMNLSAEDLLSCCRRCISGENGCEGGDPVRAWSYWIRTGIVSGGELNSYSFQSYQQQVAPECVKSCSNDKYDIEYDEDKSSGHTTYKISREPQQIQIEIMLNGPVGAHIHIYQDLFSYKEGVYQHVRGMYMDIIHAIRIVGWGEEDGVPYWLVANSWGTGWGELGGFFKVLRGTNHLDIESNVVAGKIKPPEESENGDVRPGFHHVFVLTGVIICFQ